MIAVGRAFIRPNSAMHPLAHVPSALSRRNQQANVGTTSNRLQGAHWSIGEEAELVQCISGSAPLGANPANASGVATAGCGSNLRREQEV